MTESITLSKELLVDHILAEALEYGEWDITPNPPEGAEELDYDISDVAEWSVARDGERVFVSGVTNAEYHVQTTPARRNPPGKAHPAEYETKTLPIGITIIADWSKNNGLGTYTLHAEVL